MAELLERDGASRAEVSAGRIVGAFGLRGELKLDATRIGADALSPGLAAIARFPDGRRVAVAVAGIRRHQGRPLLAFAGVADADAADAFRSAELLLARDDVALGPGEYFDVDLIGCCLVDEDGRERGSVVDVLHYPAQDLLVVGEARTYVPLVAAFIIDVDVARGEIRVRVPEGLLDPGRAEEA